MTDKYEKFIEMNNQAKDKYVPKKIKRRTNLVSQNPDIQRARSKLISAKKELHLNPCHDNEDSMKIAREEMKDTYKQNK